MFVNLRHRDLHEKLVYGVCHARFIARIATVDCRCDTRRRFRADEMVVILVMTTGGRVHARAGGLQVSEVKGEDGLR